MPQRSSSKKGFIKHWSVQEGGQEAKTKKYKITRQSQVKFKGKEHSKNTGTQKQSLDTGTRTRKTQDIRQRWRQWQVQLFTKERIQDGSFFWISSLCPLLPLSSLRRLKGKTHFRSNPVVLLCFVRHVQLKNVLVVRPVQTGKYKLLFFWGFTNV